MGGWTHILRNLCANDKCVCEAMKNLCCNWVLRKLNAFSNAVSSSVQIKMIALRQAGNKMGNNGE